MGVKSGYKRTEVGVIPQDWEVKPVNQIGTPVRGGSPRPAGDPRYFNGSYIPWLTVAALTNIPASQLVVSETATFLTEEGSRYSRTLSVGVLIIANSGATLGIAKLLGMQCCANDGIAALLNLSRNVSSHYLTHYINTRTSYLRNIVATGNGQPNLNTTLIGNLKIPLPPTKAEQEAIAEALSDADALIESLEQLLAKKRQLKQGAMQELLSGKRRLPGFGGEWGTKRLEEVSEIVMGQSPSSRYYNNKGAGLPLIQGNADIIDRKTIKRVFTTEVTKRGRCGDILMSVRAPVGGISRAMFDVCLGRGVCAIRYPSSFLYYALVAREPVWSRLSKGSTFDSVASTDVKKFAIELPKDEKEQIAIAIILSDMDTQLEAIEAKLAKARQLKQGMMQELLTGRIRLV
jgi:type I restriction enzyme S subunit